MNIGILSTPRLSSSVLPSSFIIIIYLLTHGEDFLSKALVLNYSLCFVIGEYISLDLFYFGILCFPFETPVGISCCL